MKRSPKKNLTLLGNKDAKVPESPDEAKLERFENTAGDILVPFICNEFTCICPLTGQPDFARFEILSIPDKYGLESKSLKFYLHSYRNHGAFHEETTRRIADDIWKKIQPKYLRVWGDFSVRGGIAIKPLVIKWKQGISAQQKEEYQEMVVEWDRMRARV